MNYIKKAATLLICEDYNRSQELIDDNIHGADSRVTDSRGRTLAHELIYRNAPVGILEWYFQNYRNEIDYTAVDDLGLTLRGAADHVGQYINNIETRRLLAEKSYLQNRPEADSDIPPAPL